MTVFPIAFRGLVGAGRSWAMGALSLVAGAIAVLIRFRADAFALPERYADFSESLLVPTIVAFVALVMGATVVADEREEWTVLYIAATPVARVRIVAEWVLGAWCMALILLLPAVAGAAVLGWAGGIGVRGLAWLLVAVAVVSLAYCALAGLLALLVRRAIILGMLYIVLWEGTIATFAKSADRFSLGAYGRRLVAEGIPGVRQFQVPDVGVWTAVLVPVAVTVAAVWLGGRRLSRMELP